MAKKIKTISPKRDEDSLQFAEAKLHSSGITLAQAEVLGMSVDVASKWSPTFHAVKALRLPYHDLNGKDSGFYRIRYLEQLPGFAAALAKPQRYAQEPSTLNWVYLPRIDGLDWSRIAQDSSEPLIITEGELKAACACLEGHTTIALGGVSVWQSSKKQVPLLPPLDQFNWKGRQVTIIFDSDAATNPQVAAASIRLSKEMIRLGAVARVASLPASIDNEKQGLDDFLVRGGDLGGVLQNTSVLDFGQHLIHFNENYAYVLDQDLIVKLETGSRIKRDAFVNGLHANVKVVEFQMLQNGGQKRIETLVPREWLSWTARNDVKGITYEPAAPRITNQGFYNTWSGWGCEPRAGTVAPWEALMDFLFDKQPDARTWFEQWCAYPLQHPGEKMYSAVVMWGPEQGTGKSLVGYTLGRIYGKNFSEIGNMELHSPFNEWAQSKQFIMGDEITGSDRRGEADKLKSMITQLKLRINMKHLPMYEVKDCTNWFFTSNHPDAFFIDDQDRRIFVHRVPHGRKEQDFYNRFMMWLNNGGDAFLFDYFLHLDLKDFNPSAPAMVTESKHEMVDHARSDLASFVANFLRNLDDELLRLQELYNLPGTPDLVLNRHIRQLYDPDERLRVTSNGLGRELSRHRLKTLPPLQTDSLGKQRFYVLRNHEKWLNTNPSDIKAYVDKMYAAQQPPKRKH